MQPARLMRHLFATRWRTRRLFSAPVLRAIEAAIHEAEGNHAGEILFAVKTSLDLAQLWHDQAPRPRARQVFGQIGVWDTAENNGVLIYLLLADRVVEIIADRGIAGRVPQSEWDAVCREMQSQYAVGRFQEGSVMGVQAVGRLLARHFPHRRGAAAELPDQPVLL